MPCFLCGLPEVWWLYDALKTQIFHFALLGYKFPQVSWFGWKRNKRFSWLLTVCPISCACMVALCTRSKPWPVSVIVLPPLFNTHTYTHTDHRERVTSQPWQTCQIHSDMQMHWDTAPKRGRNRGLNNAAQFECSENPYTYHPRHAATLQHICVAMRKHCTSKWRYSNKLFEWLWEENSGIIKAQWWFGIKPSSWFVRGIYLPAVALFGVDEADGGVLFVGERCAEVGTLTGEVFKLHTHCHWVGVCLDGWRHGAFNDFICFPTEGGNRTSCDVYKGSNPKENLESEWCQVKRSWFIFK